MPDAVQPRRTSFKHKYPEYTQSIKSINSKCFFRGLQAHKDRSRCPAVNKECHYCKIIWHFDRVLKAHSVTLEFMATQVKHVQSPSQSGQANQEFIDCTPEYIPVFFMSPTEVQTETIHQRQTYNKSRSLETVHKLSAKTFPMCKLKKNYTSKSTT